MKTLIKVINSIILSGKLGDGCIFKNNEGQKVYSLYPYKRCSLRWDKKKDERNYPYIYIPVKTASEIKKDVENFLIKNEIYSLLYKVGVDSPPETIENISKGLIACSLERSE